MILTWPVPLQVGQVLGEVPFSAPVPPHSVQLINILISNGLLAALGGLLKGDIQHRLGIGAPPRGVGVGPPS